MQLMLKHISVFSKEAKQNGIRKYQVESIVIIRSDPTTVAYRTISTLVKSKEVQEGNDNQLTFLFYQSFCFVYVHLWSYKLLGAERIIDNIIFLSRIQLDRIVTAKRMCNWLYADWFGTRYWKQKTICTDNLVKLFGIYIYGDNC